MKTFTRIAIALLLAGCASSPEKVAQVDPRYPYSEVETVYTTVVDALTSHYFKDYPDLDRLHTKALKDYILKEYSVERFTSEMVRDEAVPVFRRAQTDIPYRETKEFRDKFDLTIGVSVPMARMIVGGLRDVYVARFVEKDPIKTELFEMCADREHMEIISWVYGEVEAEEFRREAGESYTVQVGDRFFGFSSPEDTWMNLCGRSGYIQVRGGKIVNVVVVMMN